MIQFTIPGAPVAKGRPRSRIVTPRSGGAPFVQVYTPPETRAAELRIRREFDVLRRALAIRPMEGPLRVDLVFVLQRPAMIPKGRSRRWPEVKPDDDNFRKLFVDAMNGLLWRDDCQICAGSTIKIYGSPPRTDVRITQLSDADEAQRTLWGGIDGTI